MNQEADEIAGSQAAIEPTGSTKRIWVGFKYMRSARAVPYFFLRARWGLIVPTLDDTSFIATGYNPTDVHSAFEIAEAPFENSFRNTVHVNITVRPPRQSGYFESRS